jgi:ATPase subunit of ABC transporter with duplicated ATPase domains
MLILQDLTYIHPDRDVLFDNIHLTVGKHDKIALIGNNGTGKSTLLKIMAGLLKPSKGTVNVSSNPYYLPQLFGQMSDLSIGQALGVEDKLRALDQILNGNVTEDNLTLLNDDWTIKERCEDALKQWALEDLDLAESTNALSGGQKTRVFLAGIAIHQPEIVLLDEPTNHLDGEGRAMLYDFIRSFNGALVVVSHNRKLLNMVDSVCELSKRGITVYGGNYDFYAEQKLIEGHALSEDVRSKEKALRKAKEVERETAERKQKLDARGKKKQEKAGVPTIALNTLRNNAEKSSARLKDAHTEKVGNISKELYELRQELPDLDKMKLGFDDAALHRGKMLVTAINVNFGYGDALLWKKALSFQIISGERIALKGGNGSGKTTLIKLLLGEIAPNTGIIQQAENRTVYIDQEYSLIQDAMTVYEQAQLFNATGLQEHEVKIRLTRFLFGKEQWDKPCSTLSGGQKMRLILCCLTIGNRAPDIIILDEPTNNLDIQNVEILTAAISDYKGTLIVVSHDEYFLDEVGIERTIELK